MVSEYAVSYTHLTVVEIEEMGKAYALKCDKSLMDKIRSICEEYMPDLKLSKRDLSPLGGSDD